MKEVYVQKKQRMENVKKNMNVKEGGRERNKQLGKLLIAIDETECNWVE